jgi:hypothetical protein
MSKRLFMLGMLVIASAFVFSASASSVDGKWKTTLQTPEGNLEVIYTFKVDGEKLTGQASTYMGDAQINNGKVGENEYSFELDTGMYVIYNKFKMEEGVIKLTMDVEGYLMDAILKRVEEDKN